MTETTATKQMMTLDRDRMAATRTADQICNLLRDFIPQHCYRDAWDRVAEACHKEGMEFTSKMMRKEYETWKELTPLLPQS